MKASCGEQALPRAVLICVLVGGSPAQDCLPPNPMQVTTYLGSAQGLKISPTLVCFMPTPSSFDL